MATAILPTDRPGCPSEFCNVCDVDVLENPLAYQISVGLTGWDSFFDPATINSCDNGLSNPKGASVLNGLHILPFRSFLSNGCAQYEKRITEDIGPFDSAFVIFRLGRTASAPGVPARPCQLLAGYSGKLLMVSTYSSDPYGRTDFSSSKFWPYSFSRHFTCNGFGNSWGRVTTGPVAQRIF